MNEPPILTKSQFWFGTGLLIVFAVAIIVAPDSVEYLNRSNRVALLTHLATAVSLLSGLVLYVLAMAVYNTSQHREFLLGLSPDKLYVRCRDEYWVQTLMAQSLESAMCFLQLVHKQMLGLGYTVAEFETVLTPDQYPSQRLLPAQEVRKVFAGAIELSFVDAPAYLELLKWFIPDSMQYIESSSLYSLQLAIVVCAGYRLTPREFQMLWLAVVELFKDIADLEGGAWTNQEKKRFSVSVD